jgi:hypothetical protein
MTTLVNLILTNGVRPEDPGRQLIGDGLPQYGELRIGRLKEGDSGQSQLFMFPKIKDKSFTIFFEKYIRI